MSGKKKGLKTIFNQIFHHKEAHKLFQEDMLKNNK